jgi:hypothetical protein
MEKALGGAYLDIRSSDEATIHPANGLLIQALQLLSDDTDLVQSAHHTSGPYSHLLHCWVSKLEKDARMMCQGRKGREHMFLLNNTCRVLQMMRRPGATFPTGELMSRLSSLIQGYKKSYFQECWVHLTYTSRLNLHKFTAEFLAACGNQSTLKVTAELRYGLQQEIVDLIVPPYEDSLGALQANQSRLSGVLCWFKRVTAGKKKQKKYTGEELAVEIRELFEG